jgi:cystathionine beta-lyase/cystathionine gamma-synthase
MATHQTQIERQPALRNSEVVRPVESLPPVLAQGLPTQEGIRDTLRELSAPLAVKLSIFPFSYLVVPQGELTRYTENDHRRFGVEFQRDLTEMMMRLQRLKLHIAGDLSSGSSYNPRSSRLGGEDDDSRIQKIRALAYVSDNNTEPLSKSKSKELVRLYNEVVSEPLRLLPELPLGTAEQKILWDISFKFTARCELPEQYREQLEVVLGVINREQRQLRRVTDTPLLFGHADTGISYEETLSNAWKEYRLLVKQLSGLYERHSWFSPAYDGTHDLQQGPKQGEIAPKLSDYQRWSMAETKKLEIELGRAYMGKRAFQERVDSALTSSGLSAFESILRFLAHESTAYLFQEKRKVSRVFTTTDIYFEIDQAIATFCTAHGAKQTSLNPVDSDRVIRRIKRELPDVVVTAPLSNSFQQSTFNISKLLRELSNPEWIESVQHRMQKHGRVERYLTLVIDNTLQGPAAEWKNFNFGKLPRFVRVASFESLIKFGEDGLDVAPAGLATCIGEYFGHEFKKTGRSSTATISESTLHRLRLIHSTQQLKHKIIRHHHNTNLLATELGRVAAPDGYITKVTHPSVPSHPQHAEYVENRFMAGAVFSVALNHNYSGAPKKYEFKDFETNVRFVAQGFEKLIVHLAREANVELNVGSSFGFNNTRISLYEHFGEKVPRSTVRPLITHLRIAPGTETVKDVKVIAAVIGRANEIFSYAYKMGRLGTICQQLLDGSFSIERE